MRVVLTSRRSRAALGAIYERQDQMGTIARNTIAVIVGLIAGSLVNIGLIILGSQVIPPPEGVDVTNMESLRSSMHLFEPKHFLFPFLAHALGTLAGGFVGAMLATSQRMKIALGVSALFLIGGIINIISLPSPIWFAALDVIGAYIPMGWIAGKLAERRRPATLKTGGSD